MNLEVERVHIFYQFHISVTEYDCYRMHRICTEYDLNFKNLKFFKQRIYGLTEIRAKCNINSFTSSIDHK